jgi:streptomycin 6-kinase
MTALDDLVGEWQLRRDGEVIHGHTAEVLPVHSEGASAVLKVSTADAESEHAHLVLRRWAGDGAARLLRADPHRRAVLLERLRPQSLDTVSDVDACEIVAGLYRRLHVPAMPQLRTLTSCLAEWADEFRGLGRSAPIPHRLVEQATTLCRDLATRPVDHVVHGNLHYGNVLAADRAPWLAISPTPLNGDPHFELAPMLWNRWDELGGNVRFGVQRRFHALVDAAGLDEDVARAWLLVRVVREAALTLARDAEPAALTRFVTLAKSVQD